MFWKKIRKARLDNLPPSKTATIENRTFDEIAAGDSASIVRAAPSANAITIPI